MNNWHSTEGMTREELLQSCQDWLNNPKLFGTAIEAVQEAKTYKGAVFVFGFAGIHGSYADALIEEFTDLKKLGATE